MPTKAEIARSRGHSLRKTNAPRLASIEGAPFLLRFGALTFDYIIIVLIPVVFLLIGRFAGHDGSELLKSEWNNLGWLIAIMVMVVNFALLPAMTAQTAGKMLTGLRIVSLDGTEVSLKKILLRQFIGGILMLFSLGMLMIIAALHPRGRALHDIITGTIVVPKERQIRF